MADDPNRDILPVREGSCMDTCRSNIDPRERHIVGKLDRYQLEDRYLRLLEEACNLKKLTNRQEDKIKRLATKLMRITANPRTCMVAVEVSEDKDKIVALEIENAKLKDKILVLRNQLLSHTVTGKLSSRSRIPARPSSGRITCRSENSRTKLPLQSCRCIDENDDTNRKNNFEAQNFEAQKKEMSNRIAELEKELCDSAVVRQREKVAENIKYIQVWRQMKQLNDKLIATERENDSLNVQINDLKRMLEEKTKSNDAITLELLMEKKRVAEIDEEILKVKNSQLSLREKDEQIKDLAGEVKILQEHNNELIDLSSKYMEVELENKELKKRITEQHHEQENSKGSHCTDQANIVALQTSNEQLLGKLQELQKNIDSLTSFQTQTEKQETSQTTQISTKLGIKAPIKPAEYKDSSIQAEDCGKFCETLKKMLQLETARKEEKCTKCCEVIVPLEETVKRASQKSVKVIDRSMQTDREPDFVERKEQGTLVMTPVKEKPQIVMRSTETTTTDSILTPEKMLRLLDQAQIASDAVRIPSRSSMNGMEYSTLMTENTRHRQVVSLEKLLFGDSS